MRNAERHIAQGKIRAAIAEYKSVVDNDPKDVTTLNMLGDLYSKNSEKNEAVRCYTRVAEHYSKQGFAAKAIAVYKKISKLRPDSMEISEKLAELYKTKGSVSEAKSHYTTLAENYQNKGLKMEALAIWKQIAVLDPGNTQVYLNIAESYLQEQQPDEAAAAYAESGQRFSASGQGERAIDCFSKALDLKPNSATALTGLVDTMGSLGKIAEATERVESISKNDPHNLDIMSMLANCYLQQQKIAEAEQTIMKMVEKEPANHPRLLDIARLYLDSDDTTGAARVMSLTAENMLTGGKADEFRTWVDEILAKEPKHLSALRLLAYHCSWTRDGDTLRQALETMASTAAEADSVEDERYALSQLAMIVPQETVFADRLREINDKHGFNENPYDEAILKYQFEDQELPTDEASTMSFGALVGDLEGDFHAEHASNGNGKRKKRTETAATQTDHIGEPVPDMLERNGESQPIAQSTDTPENKFAKDIESIEFYIESGYNELAETTLKELRSEYGDLPEFDQLASRIAAAFAALASEEIREVLTSPSIAEAPVSSQDKRFDLDEIRSEFGLGDSEQADDGDDYDTHYQMATAYQEMGLMEDAIKEYQDAISCVGTSDGTRRFFQCANLLGHCFMQNGMAKLALKWYNRALEAANLTDDEKQGIWYEIAAAYEADGDTGNAAKYYEQVYAENVDYRNVGERIKNLMVHA
jgi:Predicted N-acetylglucosaminyl transferase